MSTKTAPDRDPDVEPPLDPQGVEEALAQALGNRERADRGRAIEDASRSVDPDTLLEAVGDHANARRRNDAMEALVRGGPRSVPALIRTLRQPDAELVMFAAGMLARLRETSAVPHLCVLLDHPDLNVVQQAIESLACLRSPRATGPLVRLLERDQPWLRFAAVHALGQIGGDRAVDALVAFLGDDLLRVPVLEALGAPRRPRRPP
jgi:HEAT repeat protein